MSPIKQRPHCSNSSHKAASVLVYFERSGYCHCFRLIIFLLKVKKQGRVFPQMLQAVTEPPPSHSLSCLQRKGTINPEPAATVYGRDTTVSKLPNKPTRRFYRLFHKFFKPALAGMVGRRGASTQLSPGCLERACPQPRSGAGPALHLPIPWGCWSRFSSPSALPWGGPICSAVSSAGLPSARKMRSYWRESSGGLRG